MKRGLFLFPPLAGVAVTTGLLACGGSAPTEPPVSLSGHFVAANPFPAAAGFYLALSPTVASTGVTGTGWLGGLENPLTPLSISGQLTDPALTLTLANASGTPVGTLAGTVTAAGLQGSLTLGTGSTPVDVSFARVDTNATARHSAVLAGDVAEQISASAGFAVTQAGQFSLVLAYPRRSFPLGTLGRPGNRPPAGTYSLAGPSEFGGMIVPAYAPTQRFFAISGGTLRLDISSPYALIGQVSIQAKEAATGATITMTSNFSTGCAGATCP